MDSHADLRLAALTQLYNVVVDAPLQFRVLLRTLAYAKSANLAGVLAPVVKARAPPRRGALTCLRCAGLCAAAGQQRGAGPRPGASVPAMRCRWLAAQPRRSTLGRGAGRTSAPAEGLGGEGWCRRR